jgi:hypothetical protein
MFMPCFHEKHYMYSQNLAPETRSLACWRESADKIPKRQLWGITLEGVEYLKFFGLQHRLEKSA